MLNHEKHEINKITLRRIYSLKTRFRFFRDFRGKNI